MTLSMLVHRTCTIGFAAALLVGCSASTESGGSAGSGGTTLAGSGGVGSGGTVGAGSGGSSTSAGSGGATASTGGARSTGGSNGSGGSPAGSSGGSTVTTDAGSSSGGSSGTGGSTFTPDAGVDGAPRPDAGGAAGSSGAGGTSANPTRSAGCGQTTTKPNADTQQTMTVAGKTRYYLLVVPTGYDASKAMPLMFAFHGLNQNNVWAAKDTGLNFKKITNNAAILVFPQGSGDAPGNTENWGDGKLSSMWSTSGADMDFIDMLYTDVTSKWCVDQTRVFATGFSMGGMMANGLGCKRGEKFRGVAPIEGLNATSGCTSTGTAALIQHDKNDSVVNYSQGQAAAEAFRMMNGCTATTANASGYSACVAYQGCREGFPVLFCSTTGVDHHVPSAGPQNVWTFFTSLK